jgi:hypothetical protein
LASRVAATSDFAFTVCAVVVGELLSSFDIARGPDPDGVAHDVHVTVRLTRMIDEPRQVTADGCIANPTPIDLEAPNFPALHVLPLAAQAFLMGNPFPRVVDDPRVFRNRRDRDNAPAMQFRTLSLDAGSSRRRRHNGLERRAVVCSLAASVLIAERALSCSTNLGGPRDRTTAHRVRWPFVGADGPLG